MSRLLAAHAAAGSALRPDWNAVLAAANTLLADMKAGRVTVFYDHYRYATLCQREALFFIEGAVQ